MPNYEIDIPDPITTTRIIQERPGAHTEGMKLTGVVELAGVTVFTKTYMLDYSAGYDDPDKVVESLDVESKVMTAFAEVLRDVLKGGPP